MKFSLIHVFFILFVSSFLPHVSVPPLTRDIDCDPHAHLPLYTHTHTHTQGDGAVRCGDDRARVKEGDGQTDRG